MNKANKKFWGYLGRFSIVHLISYFIIAFFFLKFQNTLPAANREALEFFIPYGLPTFLTVFIEIVRALFLALLLYPFYNLFVKKDKGFVLLIAALWGLAILGSVEPMPGSIEGYIYTETTMIEHFSVLITGLIRTSIFAWLFLKWERREARKNPASKLTAFLKVKNKKSYFSKFILLHVLTYAVIGILFYNLQNYKDAFATMEQFKLFRPLDHPLVAATIPIQILRGGILALFILPFYNTFIKKENGCLLLFAIIYGFTAVTQLIPTFIENIAAGKSLAGLIVGPIEITVQMLIFSWLFFKKRGGWKLKRKE